MLLSFLRYLRGYVSFTVRGRFPERFINITARNSVRLWDVERRGEVIFARMYMRDYLAVRPLARSSGVRLSVESRRGLPVFARRYNERLGLAVGAFVFILTVFGMSLFVWSVDISGLRTISESELRSALSAHGLSVGAFRPALDSMSVSRAVMLDDPRIGWMAVNVTGSYVSVEVKEEAPAPEVPDLRQPCNVKAARDGVIVSIEAGEGSIMLKEGSGVAEGQLIVSGVMEDQTGGVRFVRADAVVSAVTDRQMTFSVPAGCATAVPDTEWGIRRSLSLFGLRLPYMFYSADMADTVIRDRLDSLAPMRTSLPVGVVTEYVTGVEREERELDYDSAEELLSKEADLYELFVLSGCSVTARRFDTVLNGDSFELTADYTCVEDIALQEPIEVDLSTDG